MLIAYTNTGAALWTNRYDGPAAGADFARVLLSDAGGNIIVSGFSTGTGVGYDFATIKYSSAGTPVWTNRYNGAGNGDDFALAGAVDDSSNVAC